MSRIGSMRLSAKTSSSLTAAISIAASVFFFMAGSPQAAASPIFSVQSLGLLGTGASSVTALNSSGTAVGGWTNPSGDQVPVLFQSGSMSVLSGLGQANGINDSGLVVGTSFSGNSPLVAEWSNGQVRTLVAGYGLAINDSGQIAGGYLTPSQQLHAFVLGHGSFKDLGTLGGSWSSAAAINQAGSVAGSSMTSDGVFHAFQSSSKGLNDIGTLGGANSYGLALNGTGQVVGTAQTSSGAMHSFLYGNNGILDLGTLGGYSSSAYGVNDAGQIVGTSLIADNSTTHGFLDYGGVMLDLNALLPVANGWTITGAYAINGSGNILATATNASQQNYAVELAAMPLCTPEPATVLLTAAGLLAAGFCRRRRVN